MDATNLEASIAKLDRNLEQSKRLMSVYNTFFTEHINQLQLCIEDILKQNDNFLDNLPEPLPENREKRNLYVKKELLSQLQQRLIIAKQSLSLNLTLNPVIGMETPNLQENVGDLEQKLLMTSFPPSTSKIIEYLNSDHENSNPNDSTSNGENQAPSLSSSAFYENRSHYPMSGNINDALRGAFTTRGN